MQNTINEKPIKSLLESNQYIINLIKSNKPFSIVRLGAESNFVFNEIHNVEYQPSYFDDIKCTFAGIYSKKKDVQVLKDFTTKHIESIKNSDCLASFTVNFNNLRQLQNIFGNSFPHIDLIHSRTIEPFYIREENQIPWSIYLKGKKVLVINSFVKSFESQMKNGFKLYDECNIFADDQEFIYYKSYQTCVGNHIHEDWNETLDIMCNDIKTLDFDIALLGCGSYGLPLCNYIKTELHKSAIYIGGGIQLLFGVKGERWKNHEVISRIVNNCKQLLIEPSQEETIPNAKNLENGCYW
tara:strand:+ start:1773 stop:2663 length:891 start_codon:yes stop_codon:yes gene_type:complete